MKVLKSDMSYNASDSLSYICARLIVMHWCTHHESSALHAMGLKAKTQTKCNQVIVFRLEARS